ncbi:sortase-dependent protein, partial [Streptomyces sp. NPDC088135]
MPNRLLRTAVLAAVAAGAVLVPSAAAFADASPS